MHGKKIYMIFWYNISRD